VARTDASIKSLISGVEPRPAGCPARNAARRQSSNAGSGCSGEPAIAAGYRQEADRKIAPARHRVNRARTIRCTSARAALGVLETRDPTP